MAEFHVFDRPIITAGRRQWVCTFAGHSDGVRHRYRGRIVAPGGTRVAFQYVGAPGVLRVPLNPLASDRTIALDPWSAVEQARAGEYGMAFVEALPRLSEELPLRSEPGRCQDCGTFLDVHRWQEHDDQDQGEPCIVWLCVACSERIIDPHPRLYGLLPDNMPWPGAMGLCLGCKHRDGSYCVHMDARANGGPGVRIKVAKPTTIYAKDSRPGRSGIVQLWPEPPTACRSFEGAATPEGEPAAE